MARKLGLGWGAICLATALLAGCQTTSGNRFARNDTHAKNPGLAKQTPPQPHFPMNNPPANNGFNTAASGGAFPTVNPNNNFPPPGSNFASQGQIQPTNNVNLPAGNPPAGPQGLGTPTTANRNVIITQPSLPAQQQPPQTNFADPGLIVPPVPPAPMIPRQ